jgi:NTP pyrophosphatase (non-canonical NTP hydrolase)
MKPRRVKFPGASRTDKFQVLSIIYYFYEIAIEVSEVVGKDVLRS